MPFDSIGTNQPTTDASGLVGTPDTIVAISDSGVSAGVALGTSGTVLMSNGTSVAPTFQSIGTPSGGGVLGTAGFNPSSGAIVGLNVDGVISGVTYTSTGLYAVTFTTAQPDTKYTVDAIGSDDAGAAVLVGIHGTSSAVTTGGFSVSATRAGTPFDPTFIRIAVQRLSTGIVGPTGPTGPTGPAGGVSAVNTRTGTVTLVGTDIPTFIASGGSHAAGGVPDPGSSSGTTKFLREDATWAIPAGGGGGVTSVGLTAPSFLSVTGSPVTTSGVLAVTLATQSANEVFAGPASGSATAPTFRALVAADLPVFIASGGSHAKGAVPDPGSTSGTTHFLREDATWAVPAGAGGVTTVNTRSGAVTLVGTDIPTFVASGGSAAAGGVPAPGGTAGIVNFLREDASWDIPPTFTGDVDTPVLLSDTDLFLPCEDSGSSPDNIAGAGTLTGNGYISSTTGKFGNGYAIGLGGIGWLSANAVDLIPDAAIGTSFTWAMWVNTTNNTSEQSLMMISNGATITGSAWLRMNNATGGYGTVSFNIWNGTSWAYSSSIGAFFSTATTLNDGSWHFVVVTKTPTAFQFYIDNVTDKTVSITDMATAGATDLLWIGADQNTSIPYAGIVDEIQVYSRALTSTERTTLYTTGLAGLVPIPAVGYVPAPTSGDAAAGKVLGAGGTWVDGTSPLDVALFSRVFG